jgi:hypothetical protein
LWRQPATLRLFANTIYRLHIFMTTAIVRKLVLLFLAANLAACVPMPHDAHLRPAASGTIVEGGKPIPGVELFLAKFAGNNQPCTELGEIVPVSPEGTFLWAPVQEREFTESLINPLAERAKMTVLCIRHPKKGVLIGVAMFMKLNKPVSLRLVCDVARPHQGGIGPNTASAMLGQAQYCEASTAE